MSDDRIAEYRKKLLATLAGLDQLATDPERLLANPADKSNLPLINDLHVIGRNECSHLWAH